MARLNIALARTAAPKAATVINPVCNAAGEDENMELVRLTQDKANPLKWFAKFKVAPQQFKNVYVLGATTKEEALEFLKVREADIVTHESLTLRVDPAPVEEPKPGRWDKTKYWLVYG